MSDLREVVNPFGPMRMEKEPFFVGIHTYKKAARPKIQSKAKNLKAAKRIAAETFATFEDVHCIRIWQGGFPWLSYYQVGKRIVAYNNLQLLTPKEAKAWMVEMDKELATQRPGAFQLAPSEKAGDGHKATKSGARASA
jgi:hypothetical protein